MGALRAGIQTHHTHSRGWSRTMAKSGAKRRLEDNRTRLKFLGDVLNGTTAVHVLVRLLWRRKSCVWWNFAVFFLTQLACRASLGSLHSYAKPVFGENGEVLDGGESLNGGLTEYYQDLIYVGAFSLAASTFSDWFWLTMLVVPGVVTYMVVTKLVIPFMNRPRAEDDGEREETREEKRRRERAERRKQKRFR